MPSVRARRILLHPRNVSLVQAETTLVVMHWTAWFLRVRDHHRDELSSKTNRCFATVHVRTTDQLIEFETKLHAIAMVWIIFPKAAEGGQLHRACVYVEQLKHP